MCKSTFRMSVEDKYTGRAFTVIHCVGALESFHTALTGLPATTRKSFTRGRFTHNRPSTLAEIYGIETKTSQRLLLEIEEISQHLVYQSLHT